jgi:hypothetical protein
MSEALYFVSRRGAERAETSETSELSCSASSAPLRETINLLVGTGDAL